MNYIPSVLAVGSFGVYMIGAQIDGTTNIPLSAFLGFATTVFLVGMWVSAKVTRFEGMAVRFGEQQAETQRRFGEQQIENMKRLDAIDRKLIVLDDKLIAYHERLWQVERKN